MAEQKFLMKWKLHIVIGENCFLIFFFSFAALQPKFALSVSAFTWSAASFLMCIQFRTNFVLSLSTEILAGGGRHNMLSLLITIEIFMWERYTLRVQQKLKASLFSSFSRLFLCRLPFFQHSASFRVFSMCSFILLLRYSFGFEKSEHFHFWTHFYQRIPKALHHRSWSLSLAA